MTEALVNRFYASFAAGDAEAMASCYDDDITFEDPVFGELTGADPGDMWRMLCANATDLEVEHSIEVADATTALTNWVATYTFSATGRAVRNEIVANMRFVDGKISDHRDSFSVWKWSSQALGTTGRLLGWSPLVKRKVRSMARTNLAAFQAERDQT